MRSIYRFFILNIIGRIEWSSIKYLFQGRYYDLQEKDIEQAIRMMRVDRYIILLRRKTHFTTYLIGLGHWFAMKVRPYGERKAHFGFWSHLALHIEDFDADEVQLKILEAVGPGVKESTFWDVLNCDAICLLKPKNYTTEQMENVINYAKTRIGTKYDASFNLASDSEVSCVEYGYSALLHEDKKGLPLLSAWVDHVMNLTPDMVYESGDFEICLEIRR